jgi:hypothetical protein
MSTAYSLTWQKEVSLSYLDDFGWLDDIVSIQKALLSKSRQYL